ncbi:TPA: toxin-antitoxin system HicB family antitoxin [Clostridioides difficile]|nr:toxin-antitoxin system HicB family antitoxin [Clostridioides difficile]
MATITARIFPPLNESLEKVSFQTGIPKSSLILYALNDTLRKNNSIEGLEYISDKNEENIRFTLRMPEHLKLLLEKAAKNNNISVNALVNHCIHLFYVLHWSSYIQ